jgi:hypothetical protein
MNSRPSLHRRRYAAYTLGALRANDIEVFQSSEIRDLRVLSENSLLRGSFVWSRKSILEGILLHLLIAIAEVPH